MSTLKSIQEIYKVGEQLGSSQRKLQWYVTEKLLPQPIHQGKEAFYDLESTPIFHYIEIIKLLKSDCGFSFPDIRKVINNYKQDSRCIKRLADLLINLQEEYRVFISIIINFSGDSYKQKMEVEQKKKREVVEKVRTEFYNRILKGEDIIDFSLVDLQEKIENGETRE